MPINQSNYANSGSDFALATLTESFRPHTILVRYLKHTTITFHCDLSTCRDGYLGRPFRDCRGRYAMERC